jgi:hypothetical protein
MCLDEFQQPQNTSTVTVVVSEEIRKCISLIHVQRVTESKIILETVRRLQEGLRNTEGIFVQLPFQYCLKTLNAFMKEKIDF